MSWKPHRNAKKLCSNGTVQFRVSQYSEIDWLMKLLIMVDYDSRIARLRRQNDIEVRNSVRTHFDKPNTEKIEALKGRYSTVVCYSNMPMPLMQPMHWCWAWANRSELSDFFKVSATLIDIKHYSRLYWHSFFWQVLNFQQLANSWYYNIVWQILSQTLHSDTNKILQWIWSRPSILNWKTVESLLNKHVTAFWRIHLTSLTHWESGTLSTQII